MFKPAVTDTVLRLFPTVKIAYKDQSILMKVLSALLFFNPIFMTQYATTIGDTIYYPTASYINHHPVSAFVVLTHEIVHIHDERKMTKLIFSLLYLLPQLLVLPALLLFLVNWHIAIPIILLCLLPIPAYFRMIFEKRAYMASLYTMNKLNIKSHYHINITEQKDFFLQQFKSINYYYVWPFHHLDKEFEVALQKIRAGERPYNDKVFDILDQIIEVF